jgi:hypothetical protein
MQIFKIADKRFSIPTSYEELTVRQFVAISKTTDLVDILSILSDIPREDWLNCSDIDIDITLAPWLAWLNIKKDWTALKPPQSIKLGERNIDIPRNLRVHTWGQKLLLEKIWRSVVNGQVNEADTIAESVAIYLQPAICESKFDDNKIDEVKEIINKLAIVDIYPIASFFFAKYIRSSNSKAKHSATLLTRFKNKQVLSGLRSSAVLALLTLWPKAIYSRLKQSIIRTTRLFILAYTMSASKRNSKKHIVN